MTQPLFLNPVFQEKIWGGDKLATNFSYAIPSDHTGECWAISAHPNGTCTIQNGPFKGQSLDKLWQLEPQLFGNPSEPVFPLLTKILDANDDLSVQVHPDDKYGLTHEGELGKTECWYIIEADEGAEIIYGHHAKTRSELAEMIDSEQWDTLLRRVKVKAGEFYFVPSGTIHAIGAGIMILETQQSSDTTYRVYDYDRLDDQGNPRDLHIQQSIDVTTFPHLDPTPNIVKNTINNSTIIEYVRHPFFSVYEWQVTGTLTLSQKAPYTLVSVLNGTGKLSLNNESTNELMTFPLEKGMHFILPNQIKTWTFEGDLQLIASEPGQEN